MRTFRRLLRWVFSDTFIQSVKRELWLLVYRVRCLSPINLYRLFHFRSLSDLKVNVGAGPHFVEGWLNIDLVCPGKGIRWDARWGIPLKKGSVKQIHCEHFLEHLEYPTEALFFLKECRRVLQGQGQFRLIVPDAEKYIGAYSKSNEAFWERLSDLGGASPRFETEIQVVNQAFRMGGEHRFIYDKKTLEKTLKEVGFTEISEQSYCPQKYLDLPDDWRQLESLYLAIDIP